MNLNGLLLPMLLAGSAGLAQSVTPPTVALQHQDQPLATIEASQLRIRYRPPASAYPPLARIAKCQGTVVLRLTIGPTGIVEAAEALQGPPLLRFAAAESCRQWTFEPIEIGGMATRVSCDLQLPFRLKDVPVAAREVPVAQAVLDIETTPSPTAVVVDSAALQKTASAWLTQLGLKQVSKADADAASTIHIKVTIQTLRTHEGYCIQNILARASSYADRELKVNKPGEPARICFVNHVLGQVGELGFGDSLQSTVRRSLREFLVPPAPGSPGGTRGMEDQAPGDSAPVFLESSQVRVKKQPPNPTTADFIPEKGSQGSVLLQVTADPAGKPIAAEALAGAPELLMTAIRLALKWEFEPVQVDGAPRTARFQVTIPFLAREDPAAPGRTRRR